MKDMFFSLGVYEGVYKLPHPTVYGERHIVVEGWVCECTIESDGLRFIIQQNL